MNEAVRYAQYADDLYVKQRKIFELPVYPTGREARISLSTKEQARLYRKALSKLGIKGVSVTTSRYGWVTIVMPKPDWNDASVDRNYEDICDSVEHVRDTLESIWWHTFPNIRNHAPHPLEEYYNLNYSIN